MEDKKKRLDALLFRYVNGLYTRSDVRVLKEALKSGEGYEPIGEAMDEVWDNYAETSTALHQQYKAEALQLLKRIHKQENVVSLRSFLKYAAVVAIVLSAGITFYLLSSHTKSAEIPYLTLQMEYGKQQQMTFEDGTEVFLNAGSSLSYPETFENDRRVVRLNGEAFFKVAKDRSRPFIVETKNADIEVLGTAFNVKAHEEDEFLSVAVESGKVRVNLEEAMMQLLPGEQLLLDKTNQELHKSRENMEETKSWISGGLYFNKTPIRSVINELMRRYNCTIEFENGMIPNEFISGAHDNKTLESVLNSIFYTTGIKYNKDANSIILYK
ncbi:MAG: FecR domain-containing protein [Tannerella sp.]|jgi:ferric-dicitrate binding protein FerR (iron transport regulator)|nr:FecR domain-containing protein [Tannerella sp.]